nr:hypothetical protein [Tanacetum cinerariifolium]
MRCVNCIIVFLSQSSTYRSTITPSHHHIASRGLLREFVRFRLDQPAQLGRVRPILHGSSTFPTCLPEQMGFVYSRHGVKEKPNWGGLPDEGVGGLDEEDELRSCSGVKEKPNWGGLPDEGVGRLDEEDELRFVTPR